MPLKAVKPHEKSQAGFKSARLLCPTFIGIRGRVVLSFSQAAQGLIPTEAQIDALEKKRQDDESNGETGTFRPGSARNVYVVSCNDVGRAYRQI